MLGFRRWVMPAVALFAIGLPMAVAVPASAAPGDTRAALGGGSGIVLGHSIKCSLTTIGNDGEGRLVGFTAGHCAEPNAPVFGEQFPDAGPVGRVVSSNEELDYAVIQFDPAKVTPLRSVGGTTIAGVSTSPDAWDVVCQNGRTSGLGCGFVWSAGPAGFIDHACSSYGDSGGPLTVGDRLVGLVSGPLINDTRALRFSCTSSANPFHTPVIAVSFASVLSELDAAKGVGAGFQPI